MAPSDDNRVAKRFISISRIISSQVLSVDPFLLGGQICRVEYLRFPNTRSLRLSRQESPSGRRKALATSSINMKQYASPMPTQTDVKLKFKPLSKKVVSATLQFSLSCIFLREGKAT